jgi:hypothetical protein
MASAAMDKLGNIGLGFSESDGTSSLNKDPVDDGIFWYVLVRERLLSDHICRGLADSGRQL